MKDTLEIMKYFVITILCGIVSAASVCKNNEDYSGFKSYYVGPLSEENKGKIGQIFDRYNVDALSPPSIYRAGLVLVGPENHGEFIKELDILNIEHKLHADEVKKAVDEELARINKPKNESISRRHGSFAYDSYQPYFMVERYMADIARNYPTVAKLVTVPRRTFEGRALHYLKISTTNFEDTSKPVVFIDGTIHAREWVTVPVMAYTLNQLVENVTDHDLLETFDWIILPVVNPDGYDYSISTVPFWRKTRSVNYDSTVDCPGVDGNRNYDFYWGEVGTSSNICQDTYGGNHAFSEIETQVVRDVVLEYLPRLKLYITMHSFGSMILYPWGHTGVDSDSVEDLAEVARAMADAIDSVAAPGFLPYLIGNAVQLLGYGASGASEDWAHLVGVPFSYTFELPGNNFFLDPIHFEQVAYETWLGVATGARKVDEILSRNRK